MRTFHAMPRRPARSRVASLPDDRVIVATALLSLTTLVLMLCAGLA